MPYTIKLQSRPFTVLATLTREPSARRAARMLANSRREFVAARSEAGRCVAVTGPAPSIPSNYETESAAAQIASGRATNAQAAEGLRAFRAYDKQSGRNAAQVLAAARKVWAVAVPGAVVQVVPESNGYIARIVAGPHCRHSGNYVCRLSSFMRPGRQFVRISRQYGHASANQGKPILSGAWGVAVEREGESLALHTWHDAHELSQFPALPAEMRNDPFPQ